jgi:hypothetical protein
MKVKQTLRVLPTIIAVLLTVGCGGMPQRGTQDTSAKEAAVLEVRWTNDSGGTLTVENNLKEDLILFAGSINNRNNLGGIRKQSTRVIDFFDKVESSDGRFLLRAVKESVYRSKGSSLDPEKDVVYGGLIAFDKSKPRNITINIQQALGGDAEILMQNDTNMAVQIRTNRPDGPILTTLAPFERNKIVYLELNSRGYHFFPVYQYYDRANGVVQSLMPRSLADGVPMRPVAPGSRERTPEISFNITDRIELFSPFASLIVSNEVLPPRGIYLYKGSAMTSRNGNEMINPGWDETFELDLQKNSSYAIRDLQIDFGTGASERVSIQPYTYEAEYTYRVSVERGKQPIIEKLHRADSNNLAIDLVNENAW